MVPQRHVIPGVPFVRWGEVTPTECTALGFDRNIVNPSMPAAFAMILRYWAAEPQVPLDRLNPEGWRSDVFDIGTLDGLRYALAAGVPVGLSLGLTPWGHPTHGFTLTIAASALPSSLRVGPHSGILGTFLPYETFHSHEALRIHLRESVFAAQRVAIGYDDGRGVMILHDPSFGPACEVPYEDFERMWEPMGRGGGAPVPPDHLSRLKARNGPASYRARSAGERALEHFVSGYALACAERRAMAEDRYREALALPELDNALRHLILVELALQSTDRTQAIVLLREATTLVPANHFAWRILSQIYRQRVLDCPRALLAQFRANLAFNDSTRRQSFTAALPKGILVFPFS